ncbi:uncharacterized protein LOC123988815 [Osmia bicornis bicornis]|uniref:uncharacterized protein LOC123988815 n=1 Tax=Osmia bicornis bicornis TaxID=1437191 RepID=UPI001EAF5322|nr:uncharacterized protein LOC123988815 [Osmia bicornis bicornis]
MELVPLQSITAEKVAKAFYESWITRFGVPYQVITDRGVQFTSELFRSLTTICGIKLQHTTAYHPQSNGKVERLHRTLKAAIRSHGTKTWTDSIPTILLGLRTALKEDSDYSISQMVYGTTIKLPGEFFVKSKMSISPETFISRLQSQMEAVRPCTARYRTNLKIFVHKDLKTCSHVFVRTDRVKKPLEPAYEGPFKVQSRNEKYFRVQIQGKSARISIDRLKPAYMLISNDQDRIVPESADGTLPKKEVPVEKPRVSRTGRLIKRPVRFNSNVEYSYN